MPHWRSMTDREHLYAYDLKGRSVVVTIDRVEAGTLTGQGGKKSKKPVMYFRGKDKPLALNATNAKCIAKLFGSNETDDWIGKQIELYPTTTEMAGETVECIRVRPQIPRGANKAAAKQNGAQQAAPEPEQREPGDEPYDGPPADWKPADER